jgi:hypothetical protein
MLQGDLLDHGSHFRLFFDRLPLFQRSVETSATDRNQLAHALDAQAALQKRYFSDLLVDPISPVSLLFWRRASTFCKAPYDSFTCPNCEQSLRVIWPECLPSYYHPLNSKITMNCPHCGEVNEVYGFLIDKIKSAPEPGMPSVEVIAISPRDPNPDRDARRNYMQKIWMNRHVRYKSTYSQTK